MQVTLPKVLAEQTGIHPGIEVEYEPFPGGIRMMPKGQGPRRLDATERLRIFDQATERQWERDAASGFRPATERGWTREELYTRGSAR